MSNTGLAVLLEFEKEIIKEGWLEEHIDREIEREKAPISYDFEKGPDVQVSSCMTLKIPYGYDANEIKVDGRKFTGRIPTFTHMCVLSVLLRRYLGSAVSVLLLEMTKIVNLLIGKTESTSLASSNFSTSPATAWTLIHGLKVHITKTFEIVNSVIM
jgi:hypothetical protein